MIERQLIQKLSTKYQTLELNIIREYCQHLFLSHFYSKNPNIFFKGGTAIKIVFGSARFSEDLDFSSPVISLRTLEEMLIEVVKDIEKEGVSVNVSESRLTSGGYLGILLFNLYDYEVKISLQISMRKTKRIESETVLIVSDYLPDYTLRILKRRHLVEEKLQACINRAKPRDFYDVYFMLRAGLLSKEQKILLNKVKQKLKGSNTSFNKELKEFLPVNLHPVVKNFKRLLEIELDKFLPK